MPPRLDIRPGERFGRLAIIEEAPAKKGNRYFLCQCDCGKKKTIRMVRLTTRSAPTRSCGCLQRERARTANLRHGLSGGWKGAPDRLYTIWASMKTRCQNENEANFKNYGGRGIRLCNEWEEAATFIEWALANGYRDDLSIDRIDNDGNYEPSNCRWVTRKDQSLNTRRTRFLTHNGKTKPARVWADRLGFPYKVLLSRLYRGWTVAETLDTPIGGKRS